MDPRTCRMHVAARRQTDEAPPARRSLSVRRDCRTPPSRDHGLRVRRGGRGERPPARGGRRGPTDGDAINPKMAVGC